jgi:DNA-binding NarL/FixJ family response regulator
VSIRVLIADDHGIVRDGLQLLLASQPDIQVVGEVEQADRVVDAVRQTACDVAVVDLSMPGGGLSAIRGIRAAGLPARVLVLTMYEEPAYVRAALDAGAAGYLAKRAAGDKLADAIRAVHAGNIHIDVPLGADPPGGMLSGSGAGAVGAGAGAAGRARTAPLSAREREVLRFIAAGHTNREAAEELGLSIKTVEGYRARLMRKLGAHSRVDLVRHALELFGESLSPLSAPDRRRDSR